MTLKRCHSRFKPFALTDEAWSGYKYNRGERYYSTMDIASSNMSPFRKSLTGVITSRCLHCINPACCLDKLRRRSTGLNAFLFFKLTRLFVRELSTSMKALQYDLKSDISKSGNRKLFFDTHAIVCLLEKNGFSTQQAEVIVNVLVRTTHSNMDTIYSDMVTKVQQEIMLQKVMSQITSVKKDMIILEKSEFSTLLGENEKVKIQLSQLKVQLAGVMNKMRSETLLDMHIEKSRVKEMRAEHDKKVMETRTEGMEMNAEQDLHLTQTNMKIDTEVAGLKTMLESHKLDTIKYLAGSVFTCLTVVLGFYRIWM